MKKSVLFLSIFALSAIISSSAQAQDVKLKGGLTYAEQSEKLGLFLGGGFSFTPEIEATAGFSLFVPETNTVAGTEIKSSLWMFDVDGHYMFSDVSDGLDLYPLLGLNFSTFSSKVGNNKNSTTETGLNIGGGANYAFSDVINGYFELKYITGDADQGVFGLGVLYRL